jgi:hypothetical protein
MAVGDYTPATEFHFVGQGRIITAAGAAGEFAVISESMELARRLLDRDATKAYLGWALRQAPESMIINDEDEDEFVEYLEPPTPLLRDHLLEQRVVDWLSGDNFKLKLYINKSPEQDNLEAYVDWEYPKVVHLGYRVRFYFSRSKNRPPERGAGIVSIPPSPASIFSLMACSFSFSIRIASRPDPSFTLSRSVLQKIFADIPVGDCCCSSKAAQRDDVHGVQELNLVPGSRSVSRGISRYAACDSESGCVCLADTQVEAAKVTPPRLSTSRAPLEFLEKATEGLPEGALRGGGGWHAEKYVLGGNIVGSPRLEATFRVSGATPLITFPESDLFAHSRWKS